MSDSRVAWFHCFSGIAGDMALGALVDAGAPLTEVVDMCAALDVAGWSVESEEVMRGGIAGTKVHVVDEGVPASRTAGHILDLIANAPLPDRVVKRSTAVFGALAEAEAHLHRQSVTDVHFHEVGGIDAIVDVVGTCAALELLEVDDIACSPVANGLGTVWAAHGTLPNPAPAVVRLLTGHPTYGLAIDKELTTPTGAAIVAALASEWGPLPAMQIEASGFGAGTAELEKRPNLTQVVVGQRHPGPTTSLPTTTDNSGTPAPR